MLNWSQFISKIVGISFRCRLLFDMFSAVVFSVILLSLQIFPFVWFSMFDNQVSGHWFFHHMVCWLWELYQLLGGQQSLLIVPPKIFKCWSVQLLKKFLIALTVVGIWYQVKEIYFFVNADCHIEETIEWLSIIFLFWTPISKQHLQLLYCSLPIFWLLTWYTYFHSFHTLHSIETLLFKRTF